MLKNFLIITARCKSSRLPNKILKDLNKNTKCIDVLIQRAKKVKLPIIIATSKNKTDDKLCKYIKEKKYDVTIFRGSSKNKLLRWNNCFKKYNIQNACLVDGDDIFFDYDIYKRLIKKIGDFDIISSHKSMVTGVFTHVIKIDAFNKMFKLFNKNIDSEMIEPFIKKAKLKRKLIKNEKIYHQNGIRLTLDYNEDLKLMKLLSKKFKNTVSTKTILNYLKKNDQVKKINYFREAFWRKNQSKKINTLNI